MPSPFPGMDPYLEDLELWPDVHLGLIAGIREQLSPKLRPRYVARIEQRTFLPDVRIVESGASDRRPTTQRFLEVRDAKNGRIISVIELLSPTNKVNDSSARRALLRKRQHILDSEINWVEIDLLRGGERTVGFPQMPESLYLAYVDRITPAGRMKHVWPIGLRERLPILAVPLRPGESDVPLDLQAVLDLAYDRAGYDLDLTYASPTNPPLSEDDERWADALLREKKVRA